MAAIVPSPTLGMTSRAQAMTAEGIDVVSFSAGEPDFNTPEPVTEAAIQALHQGKTKYCASAGLPALRAAVAEKLSRENGLTYEPSQIVVTCGAKHAVFNTLFVLLEPGDEVILLAPYWMTYAEQIKLAGGVPKVIHTSQENGFVPTMEQLQSVLSPRTRAIIVNSPSNPTGAVYPRQTLKEIAAFALKHRLWILADEIYEHLTYQGESYTSIAALGQEVYDQTITINGCSKTYAMTGWRIGYLAAPKPVATAVSTLQDQVTSNATTFAQIGAIEALNLPEEAVAAMREEFHIRRDLMVRLLNEIPGVECATPGGAFYVFPDVRAHLRDCLTDPQLADWLLQEAHVATIPGAVFEGPGHLRLSYATSRERIEEGVARIARALAKQAP